MTSLRIKNASGTRAVAPPDDPMKAYLERLVKLIPAEVVGLYLAGKSLIQTAYGVDPLPPGHDNAAAQQAYWLGWTFFCLFAVVAVRAWATSSARQGIKPEWPAVAIATISYVVWVYSFGDVFRYYGPDWSSLAAGLVVLAWTFSVPFFYRDTGGAAPDVATTGRAQTNMRRTPPDQFSEADAEQAVIAGAKEQTNVTVGLSEKVSVRFTNARQMRRLLGEIQDVILRDHDIWVELARGSDAELEQLRAKSYADLARWTHNKVQTSGLPYSQRWENQA